MLTVQVKSLFPKWILLYCKTLCIQVTPMSDRDFGRYNCTARNNIGVRYQEFILAQAGESAELPLGCALLVS